MRERRLLAEAIAATIGSEVEPDLKAFISDAIYNSIERTEERCKTFFTGQIEGNRNFDKIKQRHAHIEDYLDQSFRQRNIQLCGGLSESGQNRATENHVNVVRRNSTLLKENLNLQGTLLLDRLIEKDVLSEDDRKSILSRKTQIAQNSAFLAHVTNAFDEKNFKDIFLPALQKDHEALSKQLETHLDLSDASFPVVRQCTTCEVRSKICIRKFANCLHESGIIDETLCSELVVSARPQEDRWNLITHKLRKNGKAVKAVLEKLYNSLYQMLKTTNNSLFVCTCDDLETLKTEVTEKTKTDHGEPDVARMSDFSSEVESEFSPANFTDRRNPIFGTLQGVTSPTWMRPRAITSPPSSPSFESFVEIGARRFQSFRTFKDVTNAPMPFETVHRPRSITLPPPSAFFKSSVGMGARRIQSFRTYKDVTNAPIPFENRPRSITLPPPSAFFKRVMSSRPSPLSFEREIVSPPLEKTKTQDTLPQRLKRKVLEGESPVSVKPMKKIRAADEQPLSQSTKTGSSSMAKKSDDACLGGENTTKTTSATHRPGASESQTEDCNDEAVTVRQLYE